MPLRPPSPQCDVPPRRQSARSPPQLQYYVSGLVAVKGTAVKSSTEEAIRRNVRVCMEERTEGKMEPEREALESPPAGTGPGALGQQRLSSWEMQRTTTTADGCSLVDGSSCLGKITSSLEDFAIGVEPDN